MDLMLILLLYPSNGLAQEVHEIHIVKGPLEQVVGVLERQI